MKRFKITKFGSLVVGAERAGQQREIVKTKRHKYGPMVMGDKPPIRGATPDPETQPLPSFGSLSLAKLTEVLTANPYYVGAALEAELRRPSGSRRGALEAIRDHIPMDFVQRDRVVAKINAMLSKAPEAEEVKDPELAQAESRTAAALATIQAQRGATDPPPSEPEE